MTTKYKINLEEILSTKEIKEERKRNNRKKLLVGTVATAAVLSSAVITTNASESRNDVDFKGKKIQDKPKDVVEETIITDDSIAVNVQEIGVLGIMSNELAHKSTNKKPNELVFKADKHDDDVNLYAPIKSVVKKVSGDSITLTTEFGDLIIKNIKVNDNIEVEKELREGMTLGASISKEVVLQAVSDKVKLKTNKDSKKFNYAINRYRGSQVAATEGKSKELLKKSNDSIVKSDILKNVVLENTNQASLLQSTDAYYTEGKMLMSSLKGGKAKVDKNVRALEPLVKKHMKKVGLAGYEEAFMAILQKESGGIPDVVASDPAQSSQSKSGSIGSISNQEESIKQGIKHFKESLEINNMLEDKESQGDVRMAIQTYNFGLGLGRDTAKDGMHYSVAYVQKKAKDYFDKSDQTKLYKMKDEWRGDARYGDFTYVSKFFNIYTPEKVEAVPYVDQATVATTKEISYEINMTEDALDIIVDGETLEDYTLLDINSIKGELDEDTLKRIKTVIPSPVAQVASAEQQESLEKVEQPEIKPKAKGGLNATEKSILKNGTSQSVDRLMTGTYSQYFLRNLATYHEDIMEMDKFYSKPLLANASSISLKGKKIYLDAGHGGESGSSYTCGVTGKQKGGDVGAVAGNGMKEGEETLFIHNKIKEKLIAAGAEVVSSRDDNVYPCLEDRLKESKVTDADLSISVHLNSSNSVSGRGTEVLYDSRHGSTELAKSVNTYFQQALPKLRERKLQDRNNLHVLNNNKIPSILLEAGFVNNPYDLATVTNPIAQESMGNAIVLGLADYFGIEPTLEPKEEAPAKKEEVKETPIEKEVPVVEPVAEDETEVEVDTDAPTDETVEEETEEDAVEEVNEEDEEVESDEEVEEVEED